LTHYWQIKLIRATLQTCPSNELIRTNWKKEKSDFWKRKMLDNHRPICWVVDPIFCNFALLTSEALLGYTRVTPQKNQKPEQKLANDILY
jgi:hypothetical protein